ncbi:MAG: MoxR family ATPase [Pirellulaceae bacterium]
MNEINSSNQQAVEQDSLSLERLAESFGGLRTELGKMIVGQEEVIEQIFLALLARGHALLVGVPGLAKTLLVRTVASALSMDFNRVQFTPDLMPADITGTEVLEVDANTGARSYRFLPGPIFSNIVLADEINRTPPKTQAALLEAMQEHQVTVGGVRHAVPEPFFVLATQNPIEQEGTYPLPEAQLDRFMLQIHIGYPSEEEELEIVRRTTTEGEPVVVPSFDGQTLLDLMRIVRRISVADHIARYALRIVRASRVETETGSGGTRQDADGSIGRLVMWGAGPRASQNLVLAAKARAALHGRPNVDSEDIRAVALPVLRHRVRPSFHADAEGISADQIVCRLIESVPELPGATGGKGPNIFRSTSPG